MSEPTGLTDPTWRPPVLTTERLRLRPVEAADAEGLFEYASNPAVTRFTVWDAHRTPDDTRAFIAGYVRSQYLAGVPDPYYGGPEGFDEVLDLCEAACKELLAHLRRQHGI